MRELRLVLKLQSLNSFRLNEIRFTRDKKQRRRLVMMLALYALLGLMGIGYAALMMWGLYTAGMSRLLPAMAVLMSAAASLMTAMIRAQALFFSPQSADLLSALPLPGYALPLSRLISLYLSALALSAAVMIPSALFYALSAGFAWQQPLLWLVLCLFAPMPALAVGLILSALPALLLQRLKNRSLLSAVITVPLITWLLLKLYTMPVDPMNGMALLSTISGGMENALAGFYPPVSLAAGALAGSPEHLLGIAAWGLLPFMLTGWALIRLHAPIQAAMSSIALRRGGRQRARARSALFALTLKEGRRIASSPLYLLNTGVGLWMMPMALLLLPLVKPDLVVTALSLPIVQGLLNRYLPLVACLFSALAVPATVSVSMEGKSAWLMCTAPVSSGVLLGSKALFSILFCLPPIALSAVLLWLHLKLSFLLFLICLLLPLALCSLSSVTGLMLDLRFARFDWENEQQIIKSSAQTGFGLLTGFLLLGLMFACFYFTPQSWALPSGYALAFLLFAAAALLMRRLSKRNVYQIQ